MKKMVLLFCAAFAAMLAKAAIGTEAASGSFSKEEDDKVSVSVKYQISLPAATDDAMKAIRKTVIAAAFAGLGYGPAKLPETDSLTDAAKVFMDAEKKIPGDVVPYRREFTVDVKTGAVKGGYLPIVVDGYDNDGGNGCHSFAKRFLFEVATGKRVTEADFMKPDAFPKWAETVRAKYKAGDKDYWKLWGVKEYPHDFTVGVDGIRWKWPAYTLGPGCDGLPETFFSWEELAPLADVSALAKLKAASGAPATESVTVRMDMLEQIRKGGVEYHLAPSKDAEVNDPPEKVFTFDGDVLHISGRAFGYLCTKQSLHDYRAILEFKFGEKTWGSRKKAARDNGLMLHAFAPERKVWGCWLSSIEVNIVEGGIGDFYVVPGKTADGKDFSISYSAEADTNGNLRWALGAPRKTLTNGRGRWQKCDPDWKDAVGFRGKDDLYKPGEWNTLEVTAKGDTIQVKLNGELVNSAFDVTPQQGRLCLQSEGAEMFVKRFEVLPL